MFNKTLFKFSIKNNYKIWLIFTGLVIFYAYFMITMLDGAIRLKMEAMMETMPGLMQAFGMASETLAPSYTEMLANYMYNMLMLLWPMVYIIMTANNLLAKQIDRTTIANLLSSPVDRLTIVTTKAVFLIKSVFLMLLVGFVFMWIQSEISYSGELDLEKFLYLNIGLFGLHFALSSVAFLASAWSSNTQQYLLIGAGVPILMFVFNMLANIGDNLRFFANLTLFSLFNSDKIINQPIRESCFSIFLLFAIGLVGYLMAIIHFKKRDLSV